jgi:hypothetical protein
MNAEPVHEVDGVLGKAHGDGHIGDGVFEDEVPADDPGNELPHRGVGIGVGRAGNGDHGSELGVTKPGKCADDRDEDERDGECGTGAGAAKHGGVAYEVVQHRSVEDGGSIELLAGNGGADDGKDAGSDDGSDAERGEGDGPESFAEPVLGLLRVGNELVDGFTRKGLAWQSPAPLIL